MGSSASAPSRFEMTFAVAPPGGFASSYEKDPTRPFAFLIPGDEELFVGGGALNGAVGKLLFEHAKQPIQFEKDSEGKYVTVKEGEKDVPKFSKHTCPYKAVQTALYKKGLAKKNTMVVADSNEIGELPLVFSAGRTYSDCDHPFGSVFIHIFKEGFCPFGKPDNAALLYCVGALGKNAKAPGEGVPNPEREVYIKNDVQEFLSELHLTGESTVELVHAYNEHAKLNKLPVIQVIRLPVVSGGIFLHPAIKPKEAALALIWGVHNGLKNTGATLAIELMPGADMEAAYKDYADGKMPADFPEGFYNKITVR